MDTYQEIKRLDGVSTRNLQPNTRIQQLAALRLPANKNQKLAHAAKGLRGEVLQRLFGLLRLESTVAVPGARVMPLLGGQASVSG